MRLKNLGFLTVALTVVFAGACVGVLYLAGGTSSASAGSPPMTLPMLLPTPTKATAPGGPPAIPAEGGMYIGADIEPNSVTQFDGELDIPQPAILGGYVSEGGDVSTVLAQAQPYEGTAPMVSWEVDFAKPLDTASMDSYLERQAQEIIAYRKPVFLRLNWEMDGTWYPDWSPPQVSASKYVADWQYVVGLFRRMGATNAAFVWCPNVGEPAGESAADWYPGNDYVDWVAADAYPRQGSSVDDFTESDGLDQLAAFAQHQGKPMMLAEWGVTSPDPDNAWLFDLVFQWAARYPDTVKALVYSDFVGTKGDHLLVDHPNGAGEFEYLIHSDSGALVTVSAAASPGLG